MTDSYGLPRLNLALGSVASQSPDGYYAINAHPSIWNEYLDEGVKFNPEYKTRDELSLIAEQGEQDPFYDINKLDLLYKLYDRLMV